MEMLLTVLCMTFMGLAVSAMALGAATRREQAAAPVAEPQAAVAPSQFFVSPAASVIAGSAQRLPLGQQVPIELLLLQFEQHVRLEQAAAETFIHHPTPDALRASMTSPLVQ
jgi:hypothetical protein